MFSLLIPLLTSLPGLVGKFFTDKNDLQKLQQKTELRKEEIRAEMASRVIEAELQRGTTQIKSTGRLFKYFTFGMFMMPFMLAMVAPEYSRELFVRLGELPQWYIETVMVLMFAVWGITVSKDVIANIFSNLGRFMLKRQENKLTIKGTILEPSRSNLPSNKEWKDPNDTYEPRRKL